MRKPVAYRLAVLFAGFSTLLLAALTVTTQPADAAPAATCLASPKGAAPAGRHWFYRLSNNRKCWYLGYKGQKGRAAARAAKPEAADPAPAPAAPVLAGDSRPAPAAPAARAVPLPSIVPPIEAPAAASGAPSSAPIAAGAPTTAVVPDRADASGTVTPPPAPDQPARVEPAREMPRTAAAGPPTKPAKAPADAPGSTGYMLALFVGAIACAAFVGRTIFRQSTRTSERRPFWRRATVDHEDAAPDADPSIGRYMDPHADAHLAERYAAPPMLRLPPAAQLALEPPEPDYRFEHVHEEDHPLLRPAERDVPPAEPLIEEPSIARAEAQPEARDLHAPVERSEASVSGPSPEVEESFRRLLKGDRETSFADQVQSRYREELASLSARRVRRAG